MNILEYEMMDLLKVLKNKFGVFEIKAEYENEGSRQTELMRLKDIAEKTSLPIIVKIGGVEAVTDIYNALSIGVKGLLLQWLKLHLPQVNFLMQLTCLYQRIIRKILSSLLILKQ